MRDSIGLLFLVGLVWGAIATSIVVVSMLVIVLVGFGSMNESLVGVVGMIDVTIKQQIGEYFHLQIIVMHHLWDI